MKDLPPEALTLVAAYFQALAEPSRLQILDMLRDGEHSVSELAEKCGCSVANASRHLSTLSKHGFVAREGRGTSVYYRIADPSVFALCELVCGSVGRRLERQLQESKLFMSARRRPRTAK